MSWASQRRAKYLSGIFLFFAIFVGIPLAIWLYESPSCTDGRQNQGETGVDKGGPCPLLDERSLSPSSVLWSRGFSVRDGTYSVIAYIENPNGEAGVRSVAYRFSLYDERNILVAVREGNTFILPGGITPVFDGGIDTGNRLVSRTYFEFLDSPVWERMENPAKVLVVQNKQMTNTSVSPRLTAVARNGSVADVVNVSFIAAVFDSAGNVFAASRTLVPEIAGGESAEIVFTWPEPFTLAVGRVDIFPVLAPQYSALGN